MEHQILGDGLHMTFYSDATIDKNITINITLNKTQRKIMDLMTANPKIRGI